MLLRYRIGSHEVEVDCKDTKAIFEQMSRLDEIFSPNCCGNCSKAFSTEAQVKYRHRTSREGHDFYELECSSCGWSLKLGQRKSDGGLFPRKEWEPPYQGGGGDAY